MGRGGNFFERMSEQADAGAESLLKLPIIELASDRRVLVENHLGIKAYCREKIMVNVKLGYICICGNHLQVLKMTREQLVVCGKIEGISIHRREKHELANT